MSVNVKSPFEIFLHGHDDLTWSRAIADLLPAIHEVDRTATLIWFKFFPLALWRVIEHSEDQGQLAKRLLLEGNYLLRNQIDSSHQFLYGHRYWPEVKKAVVEIVESEKNLTSTSLVVQTRDVAGSIAAQSKVNDSLLIGITAIAFMTLQQVGLPAFKASPGTVHLNREIAKKSPARVLRERARDDSQGILGFLKTANKTWTITFNEDDPGARFKIVHEQEIASGAATDKRDWTSVDPRCTRGEGPIPVQCRSASCGTCWIGVLGGAEKLQPVAAREARKIKEFGYINTDEPQPIIRLACQAQGHGALSIVIPPWSGVFGKFLYGEQHQSEQAKELLQK